MPLTRAGASKMLFGILSYKALFVVVVLVAAIVVLTIMMPRLRALTTRGSAAPARSVTVPTNVAVKQPKRLAMREKAPVTAEDGTVVQHTSNSVSVRSAGPKMGEVLPAATQSYAPGTGSVAAAQAEYIKSMSKDPSAMQVVVDPWKTKAAGKREFGVETGTYQLLMEQARASGVLPDVAASIDCSGVIDWLGLPASHPCVARQYNEALVADTPDRYVRA